MTMDQLKPRPQPKIEILSDPHALAEAAARRFMSLARQAISDRGAFRLALSGGSTPRLLYSLLARAPYREALNWSQVQCFWGDERCVPPDHIDSNYLLAQHTLLDRVPLCPGNIHRIRGELAPDLAAREYEAELKSSFDGRFPRFDLVLLGLGEDGHTAGLFPGSAVLQEEALWAVPVTHRTPPSPRVDRVTLTLPVLNAARHILFLVSGDQKAWRLAQTLRPPSTAAPSPAQLVQPQEGDVLWLVDRDAAVEFPGELIA